MARLEAGLKKKKGGPVNFGLRLGKCLESLGLDISGSTFKIRISRTPLKRSLFAKASLIHSGDHYKLDPMPSQSQLNDYYEREYWDARGDQSNTVNSRDISHFFMIKDMVPHLFSAKKGRTVLNFGAGHGGISHLLWGEGWTVINVEPGPNMLPGLERWNHYHALEDVPSGTLVDLIYSSNTLEHLSDAHRALESLTEVGHKETIWFLEVPDSSTPGFGGLDGMIHVPHTIYFLPIFFEDKFENMILASSFTGSGVFIDAANWRNYVTEFGAGDSIRILASGPKF